jgi:hypothetical protein
MRATSGDIDLKDIRTVDSESFLRAVAERVRR